MTVIARWLFNKASSGQFPTLVPDDSGFGNDLAIDTVTDPSWAWTSDSAGRGINTGSSTADVTTASLGKQIAGLRECSVIGRTNISAAGYSASAGPAFFYIYDNITPFGSEPLAGWVSDNAGVPTHFQIQWGADWRGDDIRGTSRFTVPASFLADPTKTFTYGIRVDTQDPDPAKRLRLWVDGVELPLLRLQLETTYGLTPTVLPGTIVTPHGNSTYYCEIHDKALSPSEFVNAHTLLEIDCDSPLPFGGHLTGDFINRVNMAFGVTNLGFTEAIHKLANVLGIASGDTNGRALALAQLWDSTIDDSAAALNYLMENVDDVVPSFALDFTTGTSVDSRLALTRASSAWYFNNKGVLTEAATDVARIDYDPVTLASKGLLIEAAATNGIRNSTMVGAGVGAAPTNWGLVGGGGVSVEVVGAGEEDGIPYVEVRWYGTSSGSAVRCTFEANNIVAASSGQFWTHSAFISNPYLEGSLPQFQVETREFASGVAIPTGLTGTVVVPTSSSLASQRKSHTSNALDATATHVQPTFRIGFTNGVTYNFTLRIGLPQLEQASFASSPIKTSSAAVTRALDQVTALTGSDLYNWVNKDAGAFFFGYTKLEAQERVIFTLYTDANNRLEILVGNGTALTRLRSVAAGVVSGPGGPQSGTIGGKYAVAYAPSDYAGSYRGGAIYSTTSAGAAGLSLTSFAIGSLGYTSSAVNGYVEFFAYFPRRIENATLVRLSA